MNSNRRQPSRIARELGRFLQRLRLRKVYFGESTAAPPEMAYITGFPRLSVPLTGSHPMEIVHAGRRTTIRPKAGEVVFLDRNCWNRPFWSSPVKVLTLLFGHRQIGLSLVEHDGASTEPSAAEKTSVHGPFEPLQENVLAAMVSQAHSHRENHSPLDCLLAQSLLHVCLDLLTNTPAQSTRKACQTHEAICLYIQENIQNELTRESVAHHFNLNPSHVSRVFRQEAEMSFSEYVNRVRINRAKFLLKNFSLPLKAVAASCGYGDSAYFCRVFKRFVKCTPTHYRLSEI